MLAVAVPLSRGRAKLAVSHWTEAWSTSAGIPPPARAHPSRTQYLPGASLLPQGSVWVGQKAGFGATPCPPEAQETPVRDELAAGVKLGMDIRDKTKPSVGGVLGGA